MFKDNGEGILIPRWLLPVILTIFLTGVTAWGTVSYQARTALPRTEAARTYVTKDDFDRYRQELYRELDLIHATQARIEDKLDRLLAR